MGGTDKELVGKVVAIQRAEGTNDADFAKALGISHRTWMYAKAGQATGIKVLAAIWRRYPGLRAEVEAYWMSKLTTEDAGSEYVEAVAV